MNYLLKSNREKKNRFPWLAVIIFVVIVGIVTAVFPTFFPTLFTDIASIFWKSENTLTGSMSTMFLTKDELLKENTQLQNTIASMQDAERNITILQSENEELKSILGRAGSRNLVLAAIVRKPPLSPYDILVIDVGVNEGIKVGDKVLVAGDIVLGEIVEVNGEMSKVKLYSSPGEKYDVQVGSENIQTTATGRGGGTFELILPREIKIAEGDSVTIPSISLNVFGTVEAIIGDPARPFQTVLFKNPVNISEQKWVEVMKNN